MTGSKILYLEGLRGFLALVVFIHHFVLLFCPVMYIGSFNYDDFLTDPTSFNIILAHSPLNIFMNGHIAVCLFLVISGYVLTYTYKNSNDYAILQHAAVKRYFRLVIPVLFACLFLKLLFISGIIESAKYPRNIEQLEFGRKLFTNGSDILTILKISFLSVPLSGNDNFLPVLWTIQVEFLGALSLFAFLMFMHTRKGKIYCGLAFVSGALYLSHYYLPLLLAGGLICMYQDRILIIFRSTFSKILLLIFSIFLAGMLNTDKRAVAHTMYAFTVPLPFNPYPYFHDLAAILLLILLIVSRKVKMLLSSNYFAGFGKLSFSIYLLHLPVIYCLGSHLMWFYHGKIHPLALFAACLCATILISLPFYKYVDKTAIRLSNKLAAKILS